MIIVVDTGPLIALCELGRVELLNLFGATVVVPPCSY
jgi:predicted nucleic acid-binding protein